MNVASSEALITSKEVKRRLGGVSDMTIHRWRERGILPDPVKIGARNFWRENDIATIAAGRTVTSAAA
jgi:predicted DNA-binding transcriptional regulator AlpA